MIYLEVGRRNIFSILMEIGVTFHNRYKKLQEAMSKNLFQRSAKRYKDKLWLLSSLND